MGEFEAIFCYASLLTDVCQNEEKLNGIHGPVMKKSLYDNLSRTIMRAINTIQWNSNKYVTCPTRSKVNVISFAEEWKHA